MSAARIGVFVALLCALALPGTAGADQATGLVQAAPRGIFHLVDQDGTLREFHLSAKQTLYEPATWRPTVGDKIDATFVVNKGQLEVTQAKLVEAGPNTIADLASPAVVTIVEKGKSGIIGLLESGHSIKFSSSRRTQWEPVGWLPMTGEKATVEFQAIRERFGFGVLFEATRIAKKTETPAAPEP